MRSASPQPQTRRQLKNSKARPRDTPINRQHRVHNYRQTLVAQIRFLNQILEENP